jgi:putative transport protein
VTHGEDLPRIARFLGDSERAAADVNPVGLGLGLGLGLLLGLVTVPLPGGGHFALGVAAGPLVMGLLLGRLGRTGPLLWSLPSAASAALNQFGMLLFLAYAGSNAGHALAVALTSSIGPRLLLTGVVVTAVAAAVGLFAGPAFAGATGPRLAGQMAAMQTQPAVLAYVNDRTNDDPRVNLGYAVVYPVAMIVKVILAPILGTAG